MRPIAMVVVCLPVALASLLATAVAQENDYLIVPGQRVGRWELGKPIDAYGFGQARGHWEGRADGRPYYDGYAFRLSPGSTQVDVFTCKNNGLVFVISPVRRANITPQPEAEETKYKTPQGVAIGTDEGELQRLLGRAESTGEWTERHGQVEVLVRGYVHPGLRTLVNRSDSKVFAVGATIPGGFGTCYDAVLGGAPVTVSLPVPMPANLRIVPPAPDIPRTRAAYSGVWVGRWDSTLDTALAVREITASGVSAVYSWGVALQWRINSPGWTNARGRFAGPDELHIQTHTLMVYRMRPDGKLDAEFGSGQGGARATMTKVFPP